MYTYKLVKAHLEAMVVFLSTNFTAWSRTCQQNPKTKIIKMRIRINPMVILFLRIFTWIFLRRELLIWKILTKWSLLVKHTSKENILHFLNSSNIFVKLLIVWSKAFCNGLFWIDLIMIMMVAYLKLLKTFQLTSFRCAMKFSKIVRNAILNKFSKKRCNNEFKVFFIKKTS